MKAILHSIFLFLIIFGPKIHRIDLSLVLILLYILVNRVPLLVHKEIKGIAVFLISISTYAAIISLIYGTGELLFIFKYFKGGLQFMLVYIFLSRYRKTMDYQRFKLFFLNAVFIHSILLFLLISFPGLRDFVYGITGYVPRGPVNIRSPGITVSFNATGIVHMAAVFLLISDKELMSKKRIIKALMLLVIFISNIFLGKTVFVIGIVFILLYLIAKRRFLWMFYASFIVAMAYMSIPLIQDNSKLAAIPFALNYKSFVLNFISSDSHQNIYSYHDALISRHYYFSDDLKVFLFGNSQAGHIGLFYVQEEGIEGGSGGGTNSDVGIVNSINALGVIITTLVYGFYIYLIRKVWRRKENTLFIFIILLTLALTFKETGFLTSHATILMNFIFVYLRFFHPGSTANQPQYVRNIRQYKTV